MFERQRDSSGRFDGRPTATVHERFMSQVSPEPMSGCWLWSGPSKNNFGHGAFKLGNRASKVEYAHRFSYSMHNGEIPLGKVVRHICNNPACVNPLHLALGTKKDNAFDKIAARTLIAGEKHFRAKATDDLVKKMRSCADRAKAVGMGVSFGISRQASHDIVSGRTWKHVA